MAVLMLVALAPRAEAVPAECRPAGIKNCSAPIVGPWVYQNISCEDVFAFLNEFDAADGSPRPACYLTTRQGWIPPGASLVSSLDFSLACPGYPLAWPQDKFGIETANFSLYQVDRETYCSPPGPGFEAAYARRTRAVVCPPGYRQVATDGEPAYCVADNAQGRIDTDKNLGPPCRQSGQCAAGNPINVNTGNKYQREIDYIGSGPNPLRFERHYNSLSKTNNNRETRYFGLHFHSTFRDAANRPYGESLFSDAAVDPNNHPSVRARVVDSIGASWRHSYNRSISLVEARGITSAFVHRPTGQVLTFNLHENAWYGPIDEELTLVSVADGYDLMLADGTEEHYDMQGRLQTIRDRAGVTQTLAYDELGRLKTVSDHYGRSLTFEYQKEYDGVTPWYDSGARNRIRRIVDPAGHAISYDYDPAIGTLIRVTYQDGESRIYHYENPAFPRHLTGITDEMGLDSLGQRYATFDYDADGRAILSMHAAGYHRVDLEYQASGYLPPHAFDSATVTDALGSRTVKNTVAQMVSRIDYETSPCRDGSCATGSDRRYTYDDRGNIMRYTDYDGRVTTYEYADPYHVNAESSRTENASDPSASRTITTEWHPRFRLPVRVTEPGGVIEFRYFEGQVPYPDGALESLSLSAIDGPGTRRWSFTYRPDGQVETIDGPRTDVADITTIAYRECTDGGGCGRPRKFINALGQEISFDAYDAHGRLIRMTDPNGLETNYDYDLRGRVIKIERDDHVTVIQYRPNGNVRKISLANGHELTFDYYLAGMLKRVTDNAGNYINYGYDANGNRISEKVRDAGGRVTRDIRWTYDALDRIRTVNAGGPALNLITFLDFDAAGRLAAVTDPESRSTTFHYDSLGRPEHAVDAGGGITRYDFDQADRLVGIAAPSAGQSISTQHEYDGLGDRLAEHSPDRGSVLYGYDAAGNVTCRADGRAAARSGTATKCKEVPERWTYTYDALNRLIEADFAPTGATEIAFEYDLPPSAGYPPQIGRLGRIVYSDPNLFSREIVDRRHYDRFGNLLENSRSVRTGSESLQFVTNYEYDSVNQLVSITYPSGRTVNYQRNAAGRITGITSSLRTTGLDGGSENNVDRIVDDVRYYPFGPARSVTYGNGLVQTRSLDTAYRVTAIHLRDNDSSTEVEDWSYQLDKSGNVEQYVNSTTGTVDYGYDALDRVVFDSAIDSDGTSPTYKYDQYGNRTWRGSAGPGYLPQSITYEADSNRMQDYNGKTCRYDDSGNLQDAGSGVLTSYGPGGRLLTLETDERNLHAYYDGVGRLAHTRTRMQVHCGCGLCPEANYYYAFGPDGRPLAMLEDQVEPHEVHWIWLDDLPVAQIRDEYSFSGAHVRTIVTYLHPDHLRAPRLGTDKNQRIVWRWQSDAFGGPDIVQSDSHIVDLRFPGQIDYKVGGIYYNYYRDYDSQTGRYLESDPIGLEGGLNTYGYAGQNPLAHVDPYGLLCLSPEAIRIVSAGIGGAAAGATATKTPAGSLVGLLGGLGVSAAAELFSASELGRANFGGIGGLLTGSTPAGRVAGLVAGSASSILAGSANSDVPGSVAASNALGGLLGSVAGEALFGRNTPGIQNFGTLRNVLRATGAGLAGGAAEEATRAFLSQFECEEDQVGCN